MKRNKLRLRNDKRATLQEIAMITGAAYSTVAAYAQRAGWTQNGVQTLLDETQATLIIEAMKQSTTGGAMHKRENLQSSIAGETTFHKVIEGVETSESRAVRMAVLAEKRIELERKFNAELEAELAELRAEKERLELKSAEDAPKIEHYEQCMSAKGAISMRNAAATLNIPGMGRNKIFAELRKKQVLDGNNIPYRKFQDAGHFRVITNSYADSNGDTHTVLTTLVFPSGLDYIRRVVTQEQGAE